MAKYRFYFLEPSKVGSQHITMIEGYLSALSSSKSIADKYDLFLSASKSTIAALPTGLTSKLECTSVPVMNPAKRRLVIKTFVELFVVLRYMVRLVPGDVLFVSCVLPTTLWLLEKVNRVFNKGGVHIVLHGEIEGLFDTTVQSFRSFGYWINKWLKSRKPQSKIKLVVLDDFIRDKLTHDFPEKLTTANVSVIHHPVIPMFSAEAVNNRSVRPSVCFIGYRSRFKGFDEYVHMAAINPSVNYLAVGGAKVESISEGTIEDLGPNDAYHREISICAAAVFPYTALYACSLSAAVLDALATGVPIKSLDRPFFRSLAEYFGPEIVTVAQSIEELNKELSCDNLARSHGSRPDRLERLARSKYGLNAVQSSFEKLLLPPLS